MKPDNVTADPAFFWQEFFSIIKKTMKDKQFEPAERNTVSPSPGLAAVNTHNPGEEPEPDPQTHSRERVNAGQQEKEAVEQQTKPSAD
jgi:membrane peptidoglycan carboxypeptidase